MAERIMVATSYDGLPFATRTGQSRVKTLKQAGFHKPAQVRGPAAKRLLAELLGHRFRQVLFQSGGKPALQHGALIGWNQQRT